MLRLTKARSCRPDIFRLKSGPDMESGQICRATGDRTKSAFSESGLTIYIKRLDLSHSFAKFSTMITGSRKPLLVADSTNVLQSSRCSTAPIIVFYSTWLSIYVFGGDRSLRNLSFSGAVAHYITSTLYDVAPN